MLSFDWLVKDVKRILFFPSIILIISMMKPFSIISETISIPTKLIDSFVISSESSEQIVNEEKLTIWLKCFSIVVILHINSTMNNRLSSQSQYNQIKEMLLKGQTTRIESFWKDFNQSRLIADKFLISNRLEICNKRRPEKEKQRQ